MSCETILNQITIIFDKYKTKFFKLPKEQRLTEYEKACGFTEKSRIGSKQFSNQFGYFMEDIYTTSAKFNKINNKNKQKGGNDGENSNEYFECKNRYDTMKQSLAYNEIKPKLEVAIKENKHFTLFILIDHKYKNRYIPLHNGFGLKKIKELNGYDEKIHRWISGNNIYEYLFNEDWKIIKQYILELLKQL